MRTPSVNTPQLAATRLPEELSTRTTCPPDVERESPWRAPSEEHIIDEDPDDGRASDCGAMVPSRIDLIRHRSRERRAKSDDSVVMGSLSPTSSSSDTKDEPSTPTTPLSSISSLSYEFSNIRLLPNHCCSFLRSGSKFVGTQQSERQVYNVDVEIKHVDMAESYLCGYLRIQGLTEDHPTLTTFFEGEIIGTKHTFQTRHASWGATEKSDMHHWSQFPAWRPLSKQARKPDFTYRNFAQREHIFMRWKEYFLVPDHRVRTISGASFDGFYYICFSQVEGSISGMYFHAKSENEYRYQQLELKHVDDHGCCPAIEFR